AKKHAPESNLWLIFAAGSRKSPGRKMDDLKEAWEFTRERNLALHVDGARIFNMDAGSDCRNVIVHTDRGGQYCSADYQAQLKR
ncbi:beta-eliminating lyase-related protein, partial [Escherichia coli]|nr:beta-eliminating lyase-related protein [Escherichia coli]